jgi:uncharacterized protein
MDVNNLPESTNVSEVGRGSGSAPRGGGIRVGAVGTILAVVVGLFLGVNPLQILGLLSGMGSFSPGTQTSNTSGPVNTKDPNNVFVSRVLGSTERTWNGIFKQLGRTYQPPQLILFHDAVDSACGQASASSGPFYCSGDEHVYLDTSFFAELSQRFGAGGAFANAYVIAHEVGHHVQNQLGISDQVMQAAQQGRDMKGENGLSVRQELQADCFAGIWGNTAQEAANITQKDVQDAIRAAEVIGDDHIQKSSRGYVNPDSFTHGSSAQRVKWFMQGFTTGDINKCDTFNVRSLN